MKHKQILNFIKIVRDSFHDSYIVYAWGGCYGFYTILKHLYPDAIAYFESDEKTHIVTKIGSYYYDIRGITDTSEDDFAPIKLTKEEHVKWQDSQNGQRLEWHLAKYQRMCKRHSDDK